MHPEGKPLRLIPDKGNKTMQLYLNNSGHRWINLVDGNRRDRLTMEDGTQKSVKYWEAIGNWAVPHVRVRVKCEKTGKNKEKIVVAHPSSKKDGCWRIGLDQK